MAEARAAKSDASFLPAIRWLRSYDIRWLRADLLAGLTLAAYLVPASVADASLANLPPQAGLYACLFSGLVFWLFCSSRQTAITVTSAISLLVGASLGDLAGGDTDKFADLAAATAVLVAVIGVLAWLFKAGAIVNFISESVLVGFKCGVALFLASTQLPKLFGFKGSHGDFWERSGHFLSHLSETNRVALFVGLLTLAGLIAGRIFLKGKPVSLLVMVIGIALAAAVGLEQWGVKLTGEIPQGLPRLGLPRLDREQWHDLIPLAVACFLLGAVETAAIGRMFAAKNGGRLNADQEFLALGMANLAAAVGRGFPVSGGMSQSLVNEGGGAKTPLSGLIAAGIMLVVVLFLSGMLRYLPQPVLAAIVLVAVVGLFRIDALKHLWRTDRTDFAVALAAMAGVLGAGLLQGVLIGGLISLVLMLRRAVRPYVATLGRLPGTGQFVDRDANPDTQDTADAMIFRPEAALVYFSVEQVRDTIRDAVSARRPAPPKVIVDLSVCPAIDGQSAQSLAGLAGELAAEGVTLRVAGAHAAVRDRLRIEGVDDALGGVAAYRTVDDALNAADPAATAPDATGPTNH